MPSPPTRERQSPVWRIPNVANREMNVPIAESMINGV